MHNNTEEQHSFSVKILETYKDRFSELDDAHRFHFASRLYHWTRNEWSRTALDNEKKLLFPSTDTSEVIALLQSIIDNGNEGMELINAAEKRRPYFEKYTPLRGVTFALFRLRHWLTCYNFDARDIFTKNILSAADLHAIQDHLFNDTIAVSILSTHAINFYYLCNRLIDKNESIPKSVIEETIKLYDLSVSEDILLYIYLLTHCIIGESLFYVNQISGENREYYLGFMDTMQMLIQDNYDNINLDNKCEFLVCASLLNFDTGELKEKIFEEATQSISNEGFYIVDTVNNNQQTSRTDLNRSEHRNILFIMAFGDHTRL